MKQIMLNMDEEKAELLRKKAFTERTSVSKLIRDAIDLYLGGLDDEPPTDEPPRRTWQQKAAIRDQLEIAEYLGIDPSFIKNA